MHRILERQQTLAHFLHHEFSLGRARRFRYQIEIPGLSFFYSHVFVKANLAATYSRLQRETLKIIRFINALKRGLPATGETSCSR